MALFGSQIDLASKDLQAAIKQLAAEEQVVIAAAAAQFQNALTQILDGYTIEIKFVRNK